MPPQPPTTFSAAKHGPCLWPLLGWPWNGKAAAQARLFDGWTAERLAAVLGLPATQVRAALRPPLRRGKRGEATPQAGQLGLTTRPLWLRPRRTGGFDAHPQPVAGATPWPAARPAEVLKVTPGLVLLRLLDSQGADRLVWLRRRDWAGLLAVPLRA